MTMKTLFLGAAVLAFAACGSDTPDDPNDPGDPNDPNDPNPDPDSNPDTTARDRDELASILGGHIRAEFGLQLALAELSRGRAAPGFAITSSNVDETHGTGTIGSMSYTFRLICHGGTAPPYFNQFCDGTAHHSHMLVMASGSQAIGTMSMDGFNRTVDWEIRDITLEKAKFKGPDNVAVTTQLNANGESSVYKLTFDATYDQVRFNAMQQVPSFGT